MLSVIMLSVVRLKVAAPAKHKLTTIVCQLQTLITGEGTIRLFTVVN
jgi:hypothetical protein